MSDSSDSEDSTYNPSRSAPLKPIATEPESCGCYLLQAVQDQLDAGLFPTTNGDYLDLIFTHREAFYAFPQGHRLCAIGFSDIAKKVECRKWRTDRDGDVEAVNAFRNEAWMIANQGWAGRLVAELHGSSC
ncbi:hypothetical protein BXZ70DRAFT_533705 [Cristinia sonorae]|uniref:Uncharacterized protein n=1 Tax=Cristinia sonorae TaxID=1940300 RepID=A0A8K0UID0_9AGAR|nr:hypothetical protein BXZ70DRAFT_533705 [Cristinia sonorae]